MGLYYQGLFTGAGVVVSVEDTILKVEEVVVFIFETVVVGDGATELFVDAPGATVEDVVEDCFVDVAVALVLTGALVRLLG